MNVQFSLRLRNRRRYHFRNCLNYATPSVLNTIGKSCHHHFANIDIFNTKTRHNLDKPHFKCLHIFRQNRLLRLQRGNNLLHGYPLRILACIRNSSGDSTCGIRFTAGSHAFRKTFCRFCPRLIQFILDLSEGLRQLFGVVLFQCIKFALIESFRRICRQLLFFFVFLDVFLQFHIRHTRELIHVVQCIIHAHCGDFTH